MSRRSSNFDEQMAKELRADKQLAREVILSFLEEGTNLKEALRLFVHSYGLTEYAKLIKMDKGNLLKSLTSGNPSYKTLEKILTPLGLTIGISVKSKQRKKKAA